MINTFGKVTLKKSRGGSGGGHFTALEKDLFGGARFLLRDVYKICQHNDINFKDCNGDMVLLECLKAVDSNDMGAFHPDFNKKGDVKFLNRVIKNGGLIEYIKKLESAV